MQPTPDETPVEVSEHEYEKERHGTRDSLSHSFGAALLTGFSRDLRPVTVALEESERNRACACMRARVSVLVVVH